MMVEVDGVLLQEGQIWEDCDKRVSGRKLRLIRIGTEWCMFQNLNGGRTTVKILTRRLRPTSTGYRVVKP